MLCCLFIVTLRCVGDLEYSYPADCGGNRGAHIDLFDRNTAHTHTPCTYTHTHTQAHTDACVCSPTSLKSQQPAIPSADILMGLLQQVHACAVKWGTRSMPCGASRFCLTRVHVPGTEHRKSLPWLHYSLLITVLWLRVVCFVSPSP